jgi:hypothetical protein
LKGFGGERTTCGTRRHLRVAEAGRSAATRQIEIDLGKRAAAPP